MKPLTTVAAIVTVLAAGCSADDGGTSKADRSQATNVRSEGSATQVKVPSVVGLPLRDAKQELRLVGLGTKPANMAQASKRVESQSPAAGTRVSTGAIVRVDLR